MDKITVKFFINGKEGADIDMGELTPSSMMRYELSSCRNGLIYNEDKTLAPYIFTVRVAQVTTKKVRTLDSDSPLSV